MRGWLISLLIHISLVAIACLLLAVTMWGPQPGANIGAAMVWLFGLGGLALPWSLLTFGGLLPEQRDAVEMILFIAFALLNVLLHGVAALWWTRPNRARSSSPARPSTPVA